MKKQTFPLLLLATACLTFFLCLGVGVVSTLLNKTVATHAVSIASTADTITALGSIHSQQEATLHFQIGGKVIYLPFQQGDSVAKGQTIASLDTYALQKQLQIQANAAQIAQNNNSQIQENQQAGIIEGQQRSALDAANHNSYNAVTEAQVITDTVNRLVANSLLTQNTAQLQTDLANYALQLATLTAPFNGVITAEDITTPNVNSTPTTSFSFADPTEKVFRANISASDIDFVNTGAAVTLRLDGQKSPFTGVVAKIYPQKQSSITGDYYLVDIQVDGLQNFPFGQNGSVLIKSTAQQTTRMVPTWLILGHTSLWVWDGKKAVLKTIATGNAHGSMTEVIGGLLPTDKVITMPSDIARKIYQLL